MKQRIIDELKNKKVLILGFGREGKSTYKFIKENNIECILGIADKNNLIDENILNDKNIKLHVGERYLEAMYEYDVIIKSPGISFKGKFYDDILYKITSQTELFLKYGKDKVIGITGTKGKSTTASLTYEMLKKKYKVMLVGNIGVPVFEKIDKYNEIDIFVFELSSHQLEHVKYSSHVSVILNMFEEHLDHYNSYEEYKEAKRNIFKHQKETDYYILNNKMKDIILGNYVLRQNVIEVENNDINIETNLVGKHNKYNINVARKIAELYEVKENDIIDVIHNFKGLPHRLEYVGRYKGIYFIDDSIATIPEASILGMESIDNVRTVIIGGMDRGIDYSKLIEYLNNRKDVNVILMNDSGRKIYDKLDKNNINNHKKIVFVDNLEEAVKQAYRLTENDRVCLLSPASASYGIFKNFEERGDKYKEYVIKYSK